MTTPLTIDVVSDVVCPWCYLGRRRLSLALDTVPDIPVVVRWRPFLLDPSIPPGGVDHREHLAAKFGDMSRLDAAHEHLTALGREVGIDYRFDRVTRYPHTVDAHRVVRWATEADGNVDALVGRLFALHFTEGADVGDHKVLAEAGTVAGLDPAETAQRLATDRDQAAVLAEINGFQRAGVTGVPCFILAGRFGVMGAQSPEILARSIRDAAARTGIAA